MKTIQGILTGLLACMCVLGSAQTAKDVKIKSIDRIRGTWKIEKIYDGKKEISPSDSTSHTFIFNQDGHYKSTVGKSTIDSGSYRLNENSSLLYLENKKSILPGSTPTQDTWKISFANNTMTMLGQGSKHANRFKYVFVKTKDGSNGGK